MILFQNAYFLLSGAKNSDLPQDNGIEIAFIGRSNAGKSSTINVLTNQKSLARVSKTPGRTQLINIFVLDESEKTRLVDLPGYGYAKVSHKMKKDWDNLISNYLSHRESLAVLVLIMDIRHPLKDSDCNMLDWCLEHNIKTHIVLTKADKVNQKDKAKSLREVKEYIKDYPNLFSTQIFSAHNKLGLDELKATLQQFLMEDQS